MNPINAPIYEALKKHASSRPQSFHVPGHQNGQVWQELGVAANTSTGNTIEAFRQTYDAIMGIDVTELSSTDDLHHPEAAIQEAQILAAQSFHAEATFFLVGGSTSGNLAMLLAVCDPGDLVIVQRNVHKSVINGLKLAGATAVFVSPQRDAGSGLAVIPSLSGIEAALQRHPQAKAVFLSNPNYYGMGELLNRYAETAHRYGVPLLVDEAHGAHYGQHREFPRSAMQAGADAAVQSTHKTLPALTMGAMLHIQGNRINLDRLKQALAIVQSSSPSFPIMASLDISRAMIAFFQEELFQPALAHARTFRAWLKAAKLFLQEVALTDATVSSKHDRSEMIDHTSLQRDPLRIVLHDSTGTLTGKQLQQLLEEKGCWAEMSDNVYVVLLIGIGTGDEHMERLRDSITFVHQTIASEMEDIAPNMRRSAKEEVENRHLSSSAVWAATALEEPVAFGGGWYRNQPSIRLPLRDAIDRRVAEMVVPYPPGIPLLYAGERLTIAMADEIERLASGRANFQGAVDSGMGTIAVYEEKPGG
ncbi:hypothetical protein B1748_27515 [Paenibacillus sp. MY03]|uniref:aminotransferase class I/II-fold pyridoxal phosphate-dependent enzyme n=1 Tax=Paenibacillus sp. MY03 TaxID=302980 RepID=UPI000B3CFAD9|nr:aminotransferase class I/II-fold pyridoxal phosphate-dependent enzyme [Paenibacillus sp. MY03]OUS70950.1 hypothetical protein B1748_27515 [Paenibacillus sp. MY03]